MKLKTLFTLSAVTTALMLAGCGGDIAINEGDIDNSVSNSNNSTGGTGTGTDNGNNQGSDVSTLPGVNNQELAGQISASIGTNVIVQVLNADVAEDTTLIASLDGTPVIYGLSGAVSVGGAKTGDRHAPATLKIEPGVVLFGRSGADYIVVHRDSKIDAQGTKESPIIMTSLQDVLGEPVEAGQWGGVVILGNAPSNKCPTDGSACALQVEGAKEGSVFGGDNWEDNSGVLKYLVVKYAGFEIAPDNELNGITFGGVGSGTTVDYIQVHANADDGVEFFGGAVQAKHLVLTGNKDDSVDWDNGFQGKLQYVYVEHDQNAGEANRGIEGDNDGTTPDKQPQSNPTIANMTIIGNNFDTADKDSEGIYLREGTGAQLYNIAITGPAEMGECFEIEDSTVTQANAQDGTIRIENSAIACGESFKNVAGQWWLDQPGNIMTESPMISSKGVPLSGSPLLGLGQNVANTVDGFFDNTNFIGALDGENDWREGWAFGFGGGEVTAEPVANGCPNGTTAITSVDGHTTTCQLQGRYTADLTLPAGNIYALNGPVFIGNDNADSATLNIAAGVTLFGREGSDYLVVSRGSKVEANGTASNPITFTSSQDVLGEATSAGQWGGIVLLGNAPSNKCPSDGSACALQVEGVEEGAVFGGTDEADNSGTLRYVVVKQAGFEIAPDNELNGITFGGVGHGTTVEYIQVHENADDGIEFFGGTVNAKYVVLTGNKDDSVDWDNGFKGKLQYVLVKHDANDGEANRAIEGDNDGTTPDKQPQSNPTISNMTVIGNNFNSADKDSEGVYLREGTLAQLSNFVITGTSSMGECLEIEDTSYNNANRDSFEITMTHSVMACENGENFKNVGQDWFEGQDGNAIAAGQADVLEGIFTIHGAPAKDWSGDTFFDNASHVGAVSADNNWTAGWTVGLE